MPQQRRYVITRPDQLVALASPARQEIVDVLSRLGLATAGEVAGALGRPADGLYYHLRALQRTGLVRAAGSRGRGRGEEALYRTAAPELMLGHDARNGRQVSSIVRSMLRLGIRDYSRASAGGSALTRGPRRELWALRATGWLTPRNLGTVNREIRGLLRSVSRPPGRGRLFGITILLTPLDHRARKPQRRPRRPRREGAA